MTFSAVSEDYMAEVTTDSEDLTRAWNSTLAAETLLPGNLERLLGLRTPPEWTKYIFSVLLALGIIGNLLVIHVFYSSKSLCKPANLYIINLALADLTFLLSSIFILVNILNNGRVMYGDGGCLISTLALSLTSKEALVAIVMIAISRYVEVVHPAWKRLNSRRYTVCLCCLSWGYCALLTLADYIQMRPIYLGYTWRCYHNFHTNAFAALLSFTLTQGLGSVIMLFCFVKIFYTFYRSSQKIFGAAEDAEMPARKARRKQEKRLATQLVVIFGVYIISWIPVHFILGTDPEGLLPTWVVGVLIVCPSVNSSINVLIYIYFNSVFRVTLIGKFKVLRSISSLEPGSTSNHTGLTATSSL